MYLRTYKREQEAFRLHKIIFSNIKMPYKIRKIKNQDLYKVINTKTGKIHSQGTTKDKAKAQVRLLETIERKLSF